MGNCFGKKNSRTAHVSSVASGSSELQRISQSPRFNSKGTPASENKTPLTTFKSDAISSGNLKPFSFSDLKAATKNFKTDSFLGEGGFGCVYKGWIDENTYAPTKPGVGIVVAIKKLKIEGYQGHKEWLAEVNYLGLLRHDNLVKLIGYCSELDNRLLVYEYMPRGSLENHLFRRGVQPISWVTRMRIAIDVSRGLAFLHNLDKNVIYRDLKASNILLDADFNAKLSDFGLARDGPTGDNTHVSTRVVGTRGYAAPEYVATGHLTTKSDIYSFGVVMLELLSGKRALDEDRPGYEESLVDWAKPFLTDNRRVLRIMDTRLGGQYSKKQAQAITELILQCLHTDPKNRPVMKDIYTQLEELNNSKDNMRRTPHRTEHRGLRHSSHQKASV